MVKLSLIDGFLICWVLLFLDFGFVRSKKFSSIKNGFYILLIWFVDFYFGSSFVVLVFSFFLSASCSLSLMVEERSFYGVAFDEPELKL